MMRIFNRGTSEQSAVNWLTLFLSHVSLTAHSRSCGWDKSSVLLLINIQHLQKVQMYVYAI